MLRDKYYDKVVIFFVYFILFFNVFRYYFSLLVEVRRDFFNQRSNLFIKSISKKKFILYYFDLTTGKKVSIICYTSKTKNICNLINKLKILVLHNSLVRILKPEKFLFTFS